MKQMLERENWANLFLGGWIFLIPWALKSSMPEFGMGITALNFWVVGIIIIATSALAIKDIKLWEEWVNLVAGVWLMISPAVFGYTEYTTLVWNSILFGISITLISATAIPITLRLKN